MKKSLSLLALLLLVTVQSFSQDNIFLKREFWDTKPTIKTVKTKIAEGNNPTEANQAHFDGLVYAILQKAPYETLVFMQQQEGNGINKLTHDGRTYLFWAAYSGNDKFMSYLLENGAKTDIRDDHDYTPLNFAANAGVTNTKVYDLLIAKGANLKEDVNHDGANALLLAITKDEDFKLTEYFTSKGLSLSDVDANGNGAFNYVARTGNTKLLDKLVTKGIKGNDQAFTFAAMGQRRSFNDVNVFKYLEAQGLNPNTTNHDNETPLHIAAARSKDVNVINYLIGKGLSVNATDKHGNTPFLNAVTRNDLSVVKAIYKNVKDINLKNNNGETALMLAVQSNKADVVTFLAENKADLNATDNKGNNLSYYLVSNYSKRSEKDFTEKLETLKTLGYNLSTPQKNGNTWYHFAIEKNSFKLLKLASEFNQDINAKNSEGNTALLLAAMKAKDDKILKYLIKNGANKTATTDFEETAFDLAQENELLKANNVSVDFLK
ncbi:ankyrin repeat domain-containing protein [Neotamlana laminarinivorans]|uniref:Ankyrin repeat domain-containing protein n=1 Tax=Neotamlana laminarinivorans TaxID=2883124 RepID=A0A9X1L2G2_9FLAO|nr:ankyrin repeat domain-containing protein [Tamlana laminarinivorans]MCB4799753.1 ankyrin repeat domain-containing protein [Tamlana laminarinivorans]